MRSETSCDYIVVGAGLAGCVVAVPCWKSGHGSVERTYLERPRKECRDSRRIMKSKSNICRQQM
jgi:succinate dehydrogenase/fumarate reductase flavoprotein subunit